MAFEIEKGVPYPTRNRGMTATLRKLEVGDSFVVSGRNAVVSATTAAKRIGILVITQNIGGDDFRVWRAEDEKEGE